eukprot:TRINITY_DN2184_c0_g1_i2.p1 TRINITY_DN2184_c0_g1~~TRINITY_DN2184_c0_g1_i2.p1  ORF type:complete len:1896 (+),score=263.11 TRINITY_DN2184_c0_g1_i2:359-6046(+)
MEPGAITSFQPDATLLETVKSWHAQVGDGRTFGSVEQYVKFCGGKRPISRVLIANNGIAAVKEMLSVRRWSYETFGNDRAIKFVVMATPEDIKANAEYIRMADAFEEVPGGSNVNNYANVPLIVDIAERTEAQAVWAGWGHASENPRLPDALSKTKGKIAFIGPPAGPMRDLGGKIPSTIIAQSAHVSCVPWSGDGITINYKETGVPEDVLGRASVHSAEGARELLKKIGYPAMIKASDGGGGKGIRKVACEEEVEAAFRQVLSEVPNSPIFIMKLVKKAHHLEVQVIADQYGEAISLYGRDCSVQRRHQKIIEEGPPVVASRDVFQQMEDAAVRMAKEVGYEGAGTVEYLYVDGQYYFLELNPRLQVEHPVTEEITKVNIPVAQLHIAMGIPLYRIPDVRAFYGEQRYEDSPIEFHNRKPVKPHGHVIAARITAENPDQGFKPTSGGIQALNFHSSPRVWAYFSVDSFGSVHEYADSQFGHVFAWGPSREEARRALVLALKELSIRGDIRTPVEFLLHILETTAFRNNAINTEWLDELISQQIAYKTLLPAKFYVVICGTVYKAYHRFLSRTAKYTSYLTKGQIPGGILLKTSISHSIIYENVRYTFDVSRNSPTTFLLNLEGSNHYVEVGYRPLKGDGLLILLDGRSYACWGKDEVTGLRLSIGSNTVLFIKENDPTILRTPTPCKLVRYLVEDGSHVLAGNAYAEVEVMKMYMPMLIKDSGIIRFSKSEGSVLSAGDIVATIELDDPSTVCKAVNNTEDLPKFGAPRSRELKSHQQFGSALKNVRNLLLGFDYIDMDKTLDEFWELLHHPHLAVEEFMERLHVIIAAVTDRDLLNHVAAVKKVLSQFKEELKSNADHSFPGSQLYDMIEQFFKSNPAHQPMLGPLLEVARKYKQGVSGYVFYVVSGILHEYLDIETPFQTRTYDDTLLALREEHKDVEKTMSFALAHEKVSERAIFICKLLKRLEETERATIAMYIPMLQDLALLPNKTATNVTVAARQMVMQCQLPTFNARQQSLAMYLQQVANSDDAHFRALQIAQLADSSSALFDVLTLFFDHDNTEIRKVALEMYVRRTYRSYSIHDIEVEIKNLPKYDNEPGQPRDFDILCSFWHFAILDVHQLKSTLNESDNMMRGVESIDDLVLLERQAELAASQEETWRYGMMMVCKDIPHFGALFDRLIKYYNAPVHEEGEFLNVLNVALTDCNGPSQDLVSALAVILKSQSAVLTRCAIRRVTLVLTRPGDNPEFFTFRDRYDYGEDPLYRNIEPPLAYHLELKRLSNYTLQYVPTASRLVHCYYAQERGKEDQQDADRCFFIRAIVREGHLFHSGSGPLSPTALISDDRMMMLAESERVLAEALNALEVTVGDPRFASSQNHHIFLKFVPEVTLDPEAVLQIMRELGEKFAFRLWQLKVREVEVLRTIQQGAAVIPLRFFASNPSGYHFKVDGYLEVKESGSNTKVILSSLDPRKEGPLTGMDISIPYPILSTIQRKRFFARKHNTTYVYDFPELFKTALHDLWFAAARSAKSCTPKAPASKSPIVSAVTETIMGKLRPHPGRTARAKSALKLTTSPVPDGLVTVYELVNDDSSTDPEGGVREQQRPVAQNNIGMVGWRMVLKTPEYPNGREVVVIANDITFQMGSFGPAEDKFFYNVSRYARARGLPRIYLAANSGARIGLAREVKDKYVVKWVDPADPTKGFKYLYLTEADHAVLRPYVATRKVVTEKGEEEYELTDVIGKEDGLGVENLRGSGLIAGETSRAYEEIFTVTLVTGRTVGIGAYLVRLGQRTVQNEGPVILTGAEALNKVLGREVYTSHAQLGGPQIMYANGVSHTSVHDELQGIIDILKWISYISCTKKAAPAIRHNGDPIDREIGFIPKESQPYDPRHMLAGFEQKNR